MMKPTIAWVDDTVEEIDYAVKQLRSEGYKIITFNKKNETDIKLSQVKQKMLKSKLDAIILDDIILSNKCHPYTLSFKTGIEILKDIRAKDSINSNTPVFIYGNLKDKTILGQFLDNGANGYIQKVNQELDYHHLSSLLYSLGLNPST